MLAINYSDNFSDNSLPFYPEETVPGTLLWIEPARTLPSGVPGNGGTLTNLATWRPTAGVTVRQSNMVAGVGAVERTAKGGIHAIRTQGNTFCQYGICLNQDVRQYILDNLSHEFFMAVAGVITRAPTGANDAFWCSTFSTGANNVKLLMAAMADGTIYPTINSNIKVTAKYPQTRLVNASPSPFLMGASVQGYTGTADLAASATEQQNPLWMVGQNWPFNVNSGGASKAFYWGMLEDCTVSGRPSTVLRDIMNLFFQNKVLTSGGMYYGDTWTSPSTIP